MFQTKIRGKKRMEWGRNAAQEIKKKGERDIESTLKFITS